MRTQWRKLNESDLIKLGRWQKRWTQQLHVSWADHKGAWVHTYLGVFACCLLKLVCRWLSVREACAIVCVYRWCGWEPRREIAILKGINELS